MHRDIIIKSNEIVKKKVISGETIIEAIIPMGMTSPNNKMLTGVVIVCAPIEEESEFEMEVGNIKDTVFFTSEPIVKMPAKAPYESMKAAKSKSWGKTTMCIKKAQEMIASMFCFLYEIFVDVKRTAEQSSALKSEGERPANQTKIRMLAS